MGTATDRGSMGSNGVGLHIIRGSKGVSGMGLDIIRGSAGAERDLI